MPERIKLDVAILLVPYSESVFHTLEKQLNELIEKKSIDSYRFIKKKAKKIAQLGVIQKIKTMITVDKKYDEASELRAMEYEFLNKIVGSKNYREHLIHHYRMEDSMVYIFFDI